MWAPAQASDSGGDDDDDDDGGDDDDVDDDDDNDDDGDVAKECGDRHRSRIPGESSSGPPSPGIQRPCKDVADPPHPRTLLIETLVPLEPFSSLPI